MLQRSLKVSGVALLASAVLQTSGLPTNLASRGEPDGPKAGISIGQLAFAVAKYLRDENAYVFAKIVLRTWLVWLIESRTRKFPINAFSKLSPIAPV